jgi:hypothetical protein
MSLRLQRTSGKIILYFHILLCGHTEKGGNAIAVGIPVREPPPHNGARGSWLVDVRHDELRRRLWILKCEAMA